MKARKLFIASAIVLAACGVSPRAQAQTPSNPVSDPNFLVLPDGKSLASVKVSGVPLSLTRGTGTVFSAASQAAYQKLKAETQSPGDHPVQWVLMDLDSHQIVDQSVNVDRKQFGASVSKVFVAGTLMDKQAGKLSANQLQLMADMLVISSNPAWVELQSQIGDGNADRGREINYNFTQRMGYSRTRGFQGTWGTMHGNELTVKELGEYLYDTYQGRYPGAEVVWKVMHTGRTGVSRAKKYIPTNVYVGGKTGTYDGDTVDPETGAPIIVHVRHQVLTFNVKGREFGLAILANTASDESAALLAGGILREYTGYTAL